MICIIGRRLGDSSVFICKCMDIYLYFLSFYSKLNLDCLDPRDQLKANIVENCCLVIALFFYSLDYSFSKVDYYDYHFSQPCEFWLGSFKKRMTENGHLQFIYIIFFNDALLLIVIIVNLDKGVINLRY